MNKLKLSKYILFLSITTFLAIFFYIVQNSYSRLLKPTQDAQNSDLIKPINPKLNLDVFSTIEKRNYSDTDNLPNGSAPTINPVPTL